MSATRKFYRCQFAQLSRLVLLITCGPRQAQPEGETARVARGQHSADERSEVWAGCAGALAERARGPTLAPGGNQTRLPKQDVQAAQLRT